MSWKRNPYYDPRVPESSSNPRLVREFYPFPKPKQDQNLYLTGFPKPKKRSIFESKNPFSGPTLQGADIWSELQQKNLPEGPQTNVFPLTLQGPDVWIQLQQSNLPGPSAHEPHVFDGNRLSDFSFFPKKW
jgi:hypothetical protein